MALHHLLYRCPFCGTDPLRGERDAAACSSCGRRFTRVRKGGVIRVEGEGAAEDHPISALAERIHALGGPLTAADDGAGGLAYSAEVVLREAAEEEPVRFRGQVLGFVEQLSGGVPGTLSLDVDTLVFRAAPDGSTASNPEERRWGLLDVRAVQSASSSVQISPARGGVVQFKFAEDSPVRWEALLKEALQRAYRQAGLGTIREFQPRIVTE